MEKIILYVDDAAYAREFLARPPRRGGRRRACASGCWWPARRA